MAELTLHTETDNRGALRIDVPENALPPHERVEILIRTLPALAAGDLQELAGTLSWKGDALALQKEWRAEWGD